MKNKSKLIILGAGKPHQGVHPAALIKVENGQDVLEWILQSFTSLDLQDVRFIGGYKIDEIVKKYPHINYSINPQWNRSKSLSSLLSVAHHPLVDTYISYSDIVYPESIIKELAVTQGDIVIVGDSKWKTRYKNRPVEDLITAEKYCEKEGLVTQINTNLSTENATGEFTGLAKFSSKGIELLESYKSRPISDTQSLSISDLIETGIKNGLLVTVIDIHGDWAEINEPQDIANFVIKTKAKTLARLKPMLKQSVISDQVSFTVNEWHENSEAMIKMVQTKFKPHPVIIRSSALAEDQLGQSMAGAFESVLNVDSKSVSELSQNINTVINSYTVEDQNNQILVQEMAKDIKKSGVIFTKTLNHGAPYYVVNLDDSGTNTDAVTSGAEGQLRTFIIHRNHQGIARKFGTDIQKLVQAVKEIEEKVSYSFLDIEFAISNTDKILIFQVRTLSTACFYHPEFEEGTQLEIDNAVATFNEHNTQKPFLAGENTMFGMMPDWNPAEIIGPKPKELAFSLYAYLITDEIWAKQRVEAGYRDLRPHPLLIRLAGHSYVDIRSSFNSFIPKDLSEGLAEKLVTHYLESLRKTPQYHDKVEFNILFTCLTFDFDQESKKRLIPNGFSVDEVASLKKSLRQITLNCIQNYETHFRSVEYLEKRFDEVSTSTMKAPWKILFLLEDCKRYGTLGFAHLARAGFVAVSLLNSLVNIGVITAAEKQQFMESVCTITSEFSQDGIKVNDNEMLWSDFIGKYGHLRPGTYDVTSSAYKEDPEHYLKPFVTDGSDVKEVEFSWTKDAAAKIESALISLKMPMKITVFDTFLRQAIVGREYSKFKFTKNSDAVLSLVTDWAVQHGLSRQDIAHISIGDILEICKGHSEKRVIKAIKQKIEAQKEIYTITQAIELPSLICDVEDIIGFEYPKSEPNYVTTGSVSAETYVFNSDTMATDVDITHKIICIPQADPGFDWVFGHKIKGLITMYGGANSHMSIRSAEFGVPAAIGVGELTFETLKLSSVVELNCLNKTIKVIK